jgi:hypothetical protein
VLIHILQSGSNLGDSKNEVNACRRHTLA